MKKFILYTVLTLAVLGALLTYILYSEGAFDKHPPKSDLEPFMKCAPGKCAPGKCGGYTKE